MAFTILRFFRFLTPPNLCAAALRPWAQSGPSPRVGSMTAPPGNPLKLDGYDVPDTSAETSKDLDRPNPAGYSPEPSLTAPKVGRMSHPGTTPRNP